MAGLKLFALYNLESSFYTPMKMRTIATGLAKLSQYHFLFEALILNNVDISECGRFILEELS